jgi:eukaryotic-like serine/threonine-protein kinase
MTADERWRQIEEIYHLAVNKPPGERTAFLERACAGDEPLRREVESLLAADSGAPGFLEIPALDMAAREIAAETVGALGGRTLGSYRLLSILGAGGMGEVYLAEDSRLGRNVAVKVLRAGSAGDAARRRRFQREARAASALNHPNIVTVYDVGSSDGLDFIVMEYVEGRALTRVVPQHGLPVSEALSYASQIAEALTRAHAAGLVHRDLKPSNVIITPAGNGRPARAKLVDFGLVKNVAEGTAESPADRTAETMIVGTAAYMSPEQARGEPLDARSDIFSFGSVLYEMLTGHAPFRRESSESTIAAILHDDPAPIETLARNLPAAIDPLVRRCTQKDAALRYQTMAEVKAAVDAIALSPGRRHRFGRPAMAAIAAAMLFGIAGAAWMLVRTPAPSGPPKVTPLTTYPGSESQPALSPDGNMVAFSWNGPDGRNRDIYLLLVGNTEPLRRTSDPRMDILPAWSPDSRSIAFVRGTVWSWEILVAPALGGPERRVADSASPLTTVSWTPDGRSLLFARKAANGKTAIFLQPLDSGEQRQLTFPGPGLQGDFWMGVGTEGDYAVFTRAPSPYIADFYGVPLGPGYTPRGEPTRLTRDNAVILGSTTYRGNLLVSFTHDGMPGVWRIPMRPSPAIERVSLFADGIRGMTASDRRNLLVYEVQRNDADIWRLDLEKGGAPQVWISSSRRDAEAQYSPDGTRIAFISDRSGSQQLWMASSDGRDPVRLTDRPAFSPRVPAWSPDSRRIVFSALDNGRRQRFLIDADGRNLRPLAGQADTDAVWAPDGRSLYVYSHAQGWNLFRLPIDGGAAEQITRKGGARPQFSPDGKYLYYTLRNDLGPAFPAAPNPLWRMPARGGEAQAEESIPAIRTGWNYAVGRRGIYFLGLPEAGGHPIRFYDFASRQTRTVYQMAKPPENGLSLSPDGRYLLFSEVDVAGSDLMLVENFRF